MQNEPDSTIRRNGRRIARVSRGMLQPSTRGQYLKKASTQLRAAIARPAPEACLVCGSPTRTVLVADRTKKAARGVAAQFSVRMCSDCGHVGNPDNLSDYRRFDRLEQLPDRPRIGTPDRQGREFHMARMAIDILGRDDVDVLIYGSGRSLDDRHVAKLPQVRSVAISDIMQLRDDAEFIDANLPAPRTFDVVVASEVVEHFLQPRSDFAHLFDYVAPDGLLVCSTNLNDGGKLGKQHYLFLGGHTSYYSPAAVERLARDNGFLLDIRVPWVATGYGGPRKRYLLMTASTAVMDRIPAYFEGREYAPSESPTANVEVAQASAGGPAVPPADPATPVIPAG